MRVSIENVGSAQHQKQVGGGANALELGQLERVPGAFLKFKAIL